MLRRCARARGPLKGAAMAGGWCAPSCAVLVLYRPKGVSVLLLLAAVQGDSTCCELLLEVGCSDAALLLKPTWWD
jgi:hypothetical protein